MDRFRTNVPTITSILLPGDPRLVGDVKKALRGPLSRTLPHCIVCRSVLLGCLELEAWMVLMQTHDHKAVWHDPP